MAELLQLFDSVEAKQYKRPDMNGDLRLGFASDDFAGTKWKNLTGTTRWSDGTEMVTLEEQVKNCVSKLLFGATSSVSRLPCIQGTLLKLLFGATSRCVQASSFSQSLDQLLFGNK